jgi:hypothetical protein
MKASYTAVVHKNRDIIYLDRRIYTTAPHTGIIQTRQVAAYMRARSMRAAKMLRRKRPRFLVITYCTTIGTDTRLSFRE